MKDNRFYIITETMGYDYTIMDNLTGKMAQGTVPYVNYDQATTDCESFNQLEEFLNTVSEEYIQTLKNNDDVIVELNY